MDSRHIRHILTDPRYDREVKNVLNNIEYNVMRGHELHIDRRAAPYLYVYIQRLEQSLADQDNTILDMNSREKSEYLRTRYEMEKLNHLASNDDNDYYERMVEQRKMDLTRDIPFIKF